MERASRVEAGTGGGEYRPLTEIQNELEAVQAEFSSVVSKGPAEGKSDQLVEHCRQIQTSVQEITTDLHVIRRIFASDRTQVEGDEELIEAAWVSLNKAGDDLHLFIQGMGESQPSQKFGEMPNTVSSVNVLGAIDRAKRKVEQAAEETSQRTRQGSPY